jgi:TolA-binding protein
MEAEPMETEGAGGAAQAQEVETAHREFERAEGEAARLIHELETQVEHLVRSNRELEEFMRESGEQKELREAIGENIVTIARRRAILEDLYQQIGAPAKASTAMAADADAPAPPIKDWRGESTPSSTETGVYL